MYPGHIEYYIVRFQVLLKSSGDTHFVFCFVFTVNKPSKVQTTHSLSPSVDGKSNVRSIFKTLTVLFSLLHAHTSQELVWNNGYDYYCSFILKAMVLWVVLAFQLTAEHLGQFIRRIRGCLSPDLFSQNFPCMLCPLWFPFLVFGLESQSSFQVVQHMLLRWPSG